MSKRKKKRSATVQPEAERGPSRPRPAAQPWVLPAWCHSDWFQWLVLVVLIVLTYTPVWQAGFIWDDDWHLTEIELRSWHGLWRIWFDLTATKQYYPLVHSIFWVEHWIFDVTPLYYHLFNIVIFSVSLLLLLKILRRLEVPGAWLAAGIFALHPMQVESVAWISEQKNMFSGLFFFSTALAYLNFDRTREQKFHTLAMGLFILGLLSKSVIAPLPGALLVIFWWQRGKLSWRQDVVPLIPFFIVGLLSGLFTAWVEAHYIGAEGKAYNMGLIDRILVAGRNVWFYPSKLLWPANLIFIYPRWNIDPSVAWQYFFPAAALALTGVLLWLSRRWRGPLAGYLYFVGMLFPAIGFFNVYPFRFSFVADHFQYLAGLGIIVPFAAGVTLLARWIWPRLPEIPFTLAGALLLLLGFLSWQRIWAYQTAEILWQDTLAKNPDCWMADMNLGQLLSVQKRLEESRSYYQRAVDIRSDLDDAHFNIGLDDYKLGQIEAAKAEYRVALKLNPDNPLANTNLGVLLVQEGKPDEAIPLLQSAARVLWKRASLLNDLAYAYLMAGRLDDAIATYQATLAIDPDYPSAQADFALALSQKGRLDEAVSHFQEALRTDPRNAEVHCNFGYTLMLKKDMNNAIAQFQAALAVDPNYNRARANLGVALLQTGDAAGAIPEFEQLVKVNPHDTTAQKYLAEARAQAAKEPTHKTGTP